MRRARALRRWMVAALAAVVASACASASPPGEGGADGGAGGDARGADAPPDACSDSDSDGACDGVDQCPGFDDRVDTDADLTADGCDLCPGFDDRIDTNNNGTPDACELQTRTIDVKKVGTNHWRGWHGTSSSHTTGNDNTITGDYQGQIYNTYFVFSLAGFAATSISSVTLELEVEAYTSADATETVAIWDVTTAPATVENTALSAVIHGDLMSGVQYGSQPVSSASVGAVVMFPLGAPAVADVQSKLGVDFAVGVHNATAPGYFRFSQAQETRIARLVVRYLP